MCIIHLFAHLYSEFSNALSPSLPHSSYFQEAKRRKQEATLTMLHETEQQKHEYRRRLKEIEAQQSQSYLQRLQMQEEMEKQKEIKYALLFFPVLFDEQ
jgi:nitrogenase subunit NifH